MRVALFGGSFDPPHHGHIAIASAAANAFELDSVLFAPTGYQPLKPEGASASFDDRLAMVELVCTEDRRFATSNLDSPRPDGLPNYTVETLSRLKEMMPEAKLYNLVGADSFLDLPRWRLPERLLELAEWIVVSRPGSSLRDIDTLDLTPTERARVHTIEDVLEDVSSTELRRRLETGEPIGDLLDSSVVRYIREHQLYS